MKKIAALTLAALLFPLAFTGCVGLEKEEQKEYNDAVLAAAASLGHTPDDWAYVGRSFAWGMETADPTRQFHFFTEKENFDAAQPLLLEGLTDSLKKSQAEENAHLLEMARFLNQPENAGTVSTEELDKYFPFHSILIIKYVPEHDFEDRGASLKAGVTYFEFGYFPHALFTLHCDDSEADSNYFPPGYALWDSDFTEYLLWQEKGEWQCQKLEPLA